MSIKENTNILLMKLNNFTEENTDFNFSCFFFKLFNYFRIKIKVINVKKKLLIFFL